MFKKKFMKLFSKVSENNDSRVYEGNNDEGIDEIVNLELKKKILSIKNSEYNSEFLYVFIRQKYAYLSSIVSFK